MIKQVWAQLGYIFFTFPCKSTHWEPRSHFCPGDPKFTKALFYNYTSVTTPADCSTLGLTSLLKSCETSFRKRSNFYLYRT